MKAFRKDTNRTIRKTYKRFLSIILMAVLGVSVFVGIRSSGMNMRHRLKSYYDEYQIYDLQVSSTLGMTNEDIEAIKKIEGVEDAFGSYEKDAFLDKDEAQYVLKVLELNDQKNKVELTEGSFPQNATECVVEKKLLEDLELKIGDSIQIRENEEEDEQVFKNTELKITGSIQSPLFISEDKGSSSLGAGKIEYYLYIHPENIDSDVATSVYITVEDLAKEPIGTKKYDEKIEKVQTRVEEIAGTQKQIRYDTLIGEANQKLAEAQEEFETEKQKAEKEIADAQEELNKAEEEIAKSEKELNSNQKKANSEFKKAEEEIAASEEIFSQKKKEAQEGIVEIEATIEQLQKNQKEIESNLKVLQENYDKADEATQVVLWEQIKKLQETQKQLQIGIQTAQSSITKINQELEAAEKKLESGKKELKNQKAKTNKQIEKGKKELAKAKQEVKDGWEELEGGKAEFDEKIAEAQEKLTDAKEKINEIEYPKWYILNRKEANPSYNEFIQESESIDNISRAFPVIFFAVATLMSLTSMTRMIEEERTQIGTLKAIGYRKTKIASKYIWYASLASILGNTIGIYFGFYALIPIIIDACMASYSIPKTMIMEDWQIAFFGFLVSFLCIVGGAIYTSFRTLRDCPAKLMRPEAPKPGKRVLLEKINFIWKHLSFIQKVTIRNIFRYKKRFLMAIIGICGATSLLLVGFGAKDSINKIVPKQNEDIYQYQILAGIKESITTEERQELLDNLEQKEKFQSGMFVNMQSVTLKNGEITRELQLMVTEDEKDFVNYIKLQDYKTKEPLEIQEGQVILTQKIADILEVRKGDMIRNSK